MIKMGILPADRFVVFNKTIINEQDKKILVMLYQPIIGSDAISLYFTLCSYLDKTDSCSNEVSHHTLMVSMQNALEDIIIAREKLEAVGLVKTFVKKGNVNNFIYEIFSPLSPKEFINNPLLSISLSSNIGLLEYRKTISFFKVPPIKLNDYEEITCLFNEVFEPVDITNFNSEIKNIKSYRKNKLLMNVEINLDEIISIIPDEMLNKKNITNETRDLLYKLVFVYNINSEQIKSIIFNSINEKHNIDKELLRENARKLYRFENGGRLPSLVYKNQPEYLRTKLNDSSNRSKIIYMFETTTPYNFLASKYHGSVPTKTDLKLVEYLLIELNLNPGVVNVLIDYVLRINNNKLTKAFVEAIAGQWCKSNIKTVTDAMKIAEDEYKNRQKIAKKKTVKIQAKPVWFDKKLEQNIASDEELKQMEKMLSEYR
ncbi:MAG: DnaD domain protein [Bacilli bacterium]